MGEAQGLDALIDALLMVRPSISVTCLLAGSGTAERRLRDRVEAAGMTNVRFLGQLTREEMPGLMAAADLHVVMLRDSPLSSITMPSKIQTTLASGKAFIAAVSGDAAAVARDSGAAFLAQPGDARSIAAAIRAAAASDVDLVQMGRAGTAYYQGRFSLESGVDRIELLLREAASDESARRATSRLNQRKLPHPTSAVRQRDPGYRLRGNGAR
jgi:glycosyltransferase involved in cell wall biosynthesis